MVVRVAVFGATGGASPSPTKSERDSAVLEGLVRGEGWWCGNPSGSRQNFFGRQHLTFDKGGKFSARRGIVRFWEGWCGGADELSVTGNFKESVETVMKGTICF